MYNPIKNGHSKEKIKIVLKGYCNFFLKFYTMSSVIVKYQPYNKKIFFLKKVLHFSSAMIYNTEEDIAS